MAHNDRFGVEVQLDSSSDSSDSDTGEVDCTEVGVCVKSPYKYSVYDDDCYNSYPKNWHRTNRFVSMTDAPNHLLQERRCLIGLRPKITIDFLETINNLRAGKMLDVPQRSPECALKPMTLSDELNELARAIWMERTSIPDGFVAMPNCIDMPGGAKLGCLVFSSPKTDEASLSWLGRQAVYFWAGDGSPGQFALKTEMQTDEAGQAFLKQCMYYPSGSPSEAEYYPANPEFKLAQKLSIISDQLLLKDCRSVGLYCDIVQVSNYGAELNQAKNLVGFVAVFKMPVFNSSGLEIGLYEDES